MEGNNLWMISGHEEVYQVPEQWPLIYKANLDQIRDADLIYPGQVLTIPRDMSQSDIDGAIHHAKTRGEWSPGPGRGIGYRLYPELIRLKKPDAAVVRTGQQSRTGLGAGPRSTPEFGRRRTGSP